MIPQTLIRDAARDGLTLAPTETGTLRVHGPKSVVAKWAPILKERKTEILAALRSPANDAHPGPLATVTVTEALISHWRLPDGRTLWVSPSETLEQVQARHPGAIPLPDSVTVTEPTSAEEAAAIAYCERVAADREAGRTPPSYTATTHCRGCGLVPIFAGAPARVDACPWCFNRTKGLPIPRPSVSCATCRHFTADPIGHGGIGSCARGGPPKGQMSAYPYAKRQCPDFEPKETTQ